MNSSNELEQLRSILESNFKDICTLNNDVALRKQEKSDLLKEMALGIIDILDSINRIEDGFKEKNLGQDEAGIKIVSRYGTVKKKLLALLHKYGIVKLEFTDNRLLVGYAKVVDTEPDPNRSNDEIVSVIRDGYIRGKELIREAEVILVKN